MKKISIAIEIFLPIFGFFLWELLRANNFTLSASIILSASISLSIVFGTEHKYFSITEKILFPSLIVVIIYFVFSRLNIEIAWTNFLLSIYAGYIIGTLIKYRLNISTYFKSI